MSQTHRTVKQITRILKHQLTGEETLELSKATAEESFVKQDLERQFDSIRADFKGRISTSEAIVNRGMRIVRDGYEMREIDCEMRYHSPIDGQKAIIRLDTLESVEQGRMTQDECQVHLPFGEIE